MRFLQCHAGVVLTASHNPPEYNGYKVYWTDGGQIVPPEDRGIIEAINGIRYEDIRFEAREGLIREIDREVDEAFIDASAPVYEEFANSVEGGAELVEQARNLAPATN